MFYKIENVKAKTDGIIYVMFLNGITKIYNVKFLAQKRPEFKVVLDNDLFHSVSVGNDGFGILWDDEHYLSSEELWKNGTEVLI